MALAVEKIVDLYRKRAANYDISANLYYLTHLFFPRYRLWSAPEADCLINSIACAGHKGGNP